MPISLVGTGLQQVYAVLGAVVLSKAPVVAIEAPEAHLHEPTSGLQLRALLMQLVTPTASASADVRQMFIATHSSIFDLDRTGDLDVCFDGAAGTTACRREGLVRIDGDHLFEPGSARHALLDAMRLSGRDEVAFHATDGTPITQSEMVSRLATGDPDAMRYLEAVTSAAVRLVALRPVAAK